MRRIYYALGVIAILALGLICCWQGSKQDPKQPHEVASAAAQGGDPTPEASEAAPIPASASIDAGQRVIAGRDAGIDAGAVGEDRAAFIRRLHVLEGSNPKLAVSLAYEDRRRFPDSPDAEERDAILPTALHNHRDVGGSKREAWYYFMHYPHGRYTEFLSRLTGLHPPSVRPSH
jgi:hypothetical protein